jgi:hypothetical protein
MYSLSRSGRTKDGSLGNHIYFHQGDDSGFKALPFREQDEPKRVAGVSSRRRSQGYGTRRTRSLLERALESSACRPRKPDGKLRSVEPQRRR